jgi:tRNA(fMet)-specific endonuclease VapC
MKYLLDTNICIYLIRGTSAVLLQKLTAHPVSDIAISSITVAELQFGVQKSGQPQQNQQALGRFILPFNIVDFDYNAAIAYGHLRAYLNSQGMPIGSLDTLIAAQALSKSLIIVTNNVSEFSRVPGLQVEDWTTS